MDTKTPQQQVEKSALQFPVVGIGASAGGLRALIEFFAHVPADSGMAFVVISHLSPDHESQLPEVLQKSCAMPVVQVRESTAIQADHVYVISPKSALAMVDGHLDPHARREGPREMTIDRFFETLSEAHGRNAFAVVLSGSGSDGTTGVKAAKAAGGVTFAQEPGEAEYDAMPRNAIGSGAVDFVLPVGAIPDKLAAVWRSARRIELPYVIADSIDALAREADQNEITLDMQIGEDPMIVAADAVRVRQVAWNLVSNALKFTRPGGTVRVELARDGNEARMVVEDNGQGIEPEQLPRIFDWFRQGETGSKRRRGGLGIGLALVKQLVELHGGRVTAESKGPGKGARFTVWLPLQTAEAPRMLTAAPVSEAPGERLKGLRVLIIDDAPANAEALCDLLRFEGATTVMETSASGAVELARREPFDVIVSDLAMPKMDGYEMLEQIRAGTLNAATPAIAYSGYGGPEEVARSKAAGFDMHITKPVDLSRMLEAIEALRDRGGERKRA